MKLKLARFGSAKEIANEKVYFLGTFGLGSLEIEYLQMVSTQEAELSF